jgi:hypothetical protein
MTAAPWTADHLAGALPPPPPSCGKEAEAPMEEPRSFRAESYGMLTTLRFLLHYITFWRVIPILSQLVHNKYTNSKSLLQRIHASQDRFFFQSPKACMTSEFYIEVAILQTLAALPLITQLHHMKGHQDLEQLKTLHISWEAHLNII